MRDYDRNERYQTDEFDDYEEDGEEEEFDEEYEEREAPKPTKEELDYLGLRERLKEEARRRMKMENGDSFGKSLKEKKRLPHDNFGSFFGPSQPVIAQRVIQESKSLLENQHLADRISNSNTIKKKAPVSTNNVAIPAIRPPRKLTPEVQARLKAQKLKDNRDYDFLRSDDADLPAPRKDPGNIQNQNSAQAQAKNRPSTSSHTKSSFFSGRDERRPASANSQHHQVASGSRQSNVPSAGVRKQPGSSNGSGPGRPMGPKGLPPKTSAPSRASMSNNRLSLDNKKPSFVDTKKPVNGKAPISRPHSSVQRQQYDQRRDVREPERGRPHSSVQRQQYDQRRDVREPERGRPNSSKMPVTSSRPQSKLPSRQIVSRPPMQADRPKKRPSGPFDDEDEEDPMEAIRKMFRYDPRKFAGVDDDDSDMEAGFHEVEMEEKRSARIARKEDEEQLRLIEEEERQEEEARLRREAKKRRLSQSQR